MMTTLFFLCFNYAAYCAELIREKVTEARETLLREFDDERSHHQKMMSDYTRLQQRFENLQDVRLLTSPPSNPNVAPDGSAFDVDRFLPVNDIADSVSEMSDAGGDTVSLDGMQTVS